MLKRGNDARGGERMALGRNIRKRIEADRQLGVGCIEIANRMGAIGRDAIRDCLGKVAVGVNYGHSFAGPDVVHGQVEEHGALARARFADNVNVPLAVSPRERNVILRQTVPLCG
jgi:hypothetical protein